MRSADRHGRAGRKCTMVVAALVLVPVLLAGCGRHAPADPGQRGANLSGQIAIDGSSTVFPITEAVAYEFGKVYRRVRVNVGVSGTGGGFAKWARGEVTIIGASRPIEPAERQQAAANGIEPIEFAIAYDGLSLVVNHENDWADCLTVEQLREIWSEHGRIQRWSQIDPAWPDRPISLYGPGTDSGTFDYFNEAVLESGGEGYSHTTRYTASEDDNFLVQGIAGDPYALGYFGFAYYRENRDQVRAVAVDGGSGCVEPSEETIRNGSYVPLSRPLYIYVSSRAIARPEVQAFVRFYLEHAAELVGRVGYIPLPAEMYEEGLTKLEQVTP